jgi:hypothetical protein
MLAASWRNWRARSSELAASIRIWSRRLERLGDGWLEKAWKRPWQQRGPWGDSGNR